LATFAPRNELTGHGQAVWMKTILLEKLEEFFAMLR
jgi:hypothetical protein